MQKQFAASVRSMSLDRPEASLAATGIKPHMIVVDNWPPQVIISISPAILEPIDGAPALKPVAGNDRAAGDIDGHAW